MSTKSDSPVWDFPTRLFHWLLAALVAFSWYSAEFSTSLDAREWHAYSGYAIFGLVIFRLIWGVFGGRYARFQNFLRGPRAIADYLRGQNRETLSRGHNPLGALSVVGLLLVLLVQTITGLMSNDDILFEGPLFHLVDKETSDLMTTIHHYSWSVLQVLIVIHLLAVLAYLVLRRDNLITPMITGRKAGQSPDDGPPVTMSLQRVIAAVLTAAAITWLITGYL
ncbi:MAG: cytochrome b/b6 domain-containing protein [Rhodospirillales bacterium]